MYQFFIVRQSANNISSKMDIDILNDPDLYRALVKNSLSDFLSSKKLPSSNDKEKPLRICVHKGVESAQTTGFVNFYLINNPIP
ncbi:hypothetical protein PITCH_A1920011 [uncultured Desulfobacterium sp.]|uniref:Uncharacterized protein n=1 Tax=uncultured Desulfobacterium sp. TaxID=201089 RepID=A0A445MWC1_9BACT|nr:hypothetical protein PITCH_A1920011 [uncultured Desulfobacterium sp.]